MKKTFVLLLFGAILFFSFQSVQAQGLKIGVGGGLSIVQAPGYYKDVKGFSTEYHVGLKGRLDIPLFPFTPVGFVEYHFLRGSESTSAGSADTKQDILSLGVGAEFSMAPGPLSPYLGLDLEYNSIGDLQTSGLPTISGFSRMGIGIGAGVMFSLVVVDIDVSVKYQMLNLIGKKSGEETIGIINLNAAIFF